MGDEPSSGGPLVGRAATELAALVRAGEIRPTEVVAAHLQRIERVDGRLAAFVVVRGEAALAEAAELERRHDLADLPLAGVPVAIKDNVDVAGEVTREGSLATPEGRAQADHPLVAALRAAGAVVVGKTAVPELCVWGATDRPGAITRNPWDVQRAPGGSSGGAAAAVAGGMVPLAHAADGMGSIRIPAASCGLFGMKPGPGVVPFGLGASSWLGLSEHGPLATTVGDAALFLDVLAGGAGLAAPAPPARPLRIAISVASPGVGVQAEAAFVRAVGRVGEVLADAGHRVTTADPPYALRHGIAAVARWTAAVAEEAEALPQDLLQRRTRTHARIGRVSRRLGRGRDRHARAWREALAPLFTDHDLLLTPGLAHTPIPAEPWHERSWYANFAANLDYAPFASLWNLARYPAASVPAGIHPDGLPLAVQLVAPPGNEARILAVACQVEALRPWVRHAPMVEQP